MPNDPLNQGQAEKSEATAQAQAQSKINEDLLIAIERQKEINRLQKEQFQMAIQLNEAYQSGLSLQTKQMRELQESVKDAEQKGLLSLSQKGEYLQNFNKQLEKMKLDPILVKELEKLQNQFATGEIDTKKFIGGIDKIRAKAEDVEDFSRKVEGNFSSIGAKIGIASDIGNTKIGGLAETLGSFATGLTEMKIGAIFAGMGQFVATAFASMIDNAIDLAFELDALAKKFQSTTGYNVDLQKSFTKLSDDMILSGVTTENVSAAFSALSTNVASFNPHATELNERLAKQVALLEKVGVGVNESTKAMNMFEKSLGMTSEAASQMVLELSTMGTNIGIETKKMMGDINSAMPNLLQFGSRSTQVFTGLAAQAKQTGIEMSKLISIAEKFETFDDAADNTAKLNAMLGTNFSTMEMLTADYDDKINILRSGLQGSITDLSKMDKFTQKFVRDALGVGSVAEAQALLNMSTSEFLTYQKDMEAQAKTQADLQKQTQELVIPMEKLKLAFMKIAYAFLPLVEMFVSFVDVVKPVELATFVLSAVLTGVGYAAVVLRGHVTALKTSMAGLTIGFILFGAGLAMLTSQSPLIKALGAAFVVMGAGIMLTSLGVELATAKFMWFAVALGVVYGILSSRLNPIFINAFFWMALGLRAMISAMNTAQPQMLIVAAAFAIIGLSLAVVIYAFKELLSVATEFFELAINNHDKLFMVAFGIAAIAFAINFLTISMLAGLTVSILYVATLGMMVAAMLATGLGTTMKFDMNGLIEFGNAMKMIGAGMTQYVKGLAKIASLTTQVKASVGNGLFAATVEGGKTSVIMAGEGTLKAISASKIEVDVKIPEIKIPQSVVHVYLDGKEIATKVKQEFNEV